FRSNIARTSASAMPSIDPYHPRPALFTRTSMPPKCFSAFRTALPGMRARGNGWIINMSSVAGMRGITGFGYYSATKFAVEAVT
ncbi:hypothetical protein C6A85_16710, partial [Mycobacterium sp. ITM-2017-0098]